MSDSDDGIFFGPITLKEIKKYALGNSIPSKPVKSLQRRSARQRLIKKEKISMDSQEAVEVIYISDSSSESDILNKTNLDSETNEKVDEEILDIDTCVIDLCSDKSYEETSFNETETTSLNNLSMKMNVISFETNNLSSSPASNDLVSDENDPESPESVSFSISHSQVQCENLPSESNSVKQNTSVKANEELTLNSTYVLNFSSAMYRDNSENPVLLEEEEVNIEVLPNLSQNKNIVSLEDLQIVVSPCDKSKDITHQLESVDLQEKNVQPCKSDESYDLLPKSDKNGEVSPKFDKNEVLSESDESNYKGNKESTAFTEGNIVGENLKKEMKYLDKQDISTGLNSILNLKYIDDSLTSSIISGVYDINVTRENICLDQSSQKNSSFELKDQIRSEKDNLLLNSINKEPVDVQNLNVTGIQNDISNGVNIEAIEVSNKEYNNSIQLDDVNVENNEMEPLSNTQNLNNENDLNKSSQHMIEINSGNVNDEDSMKENNINLTNKSIHGNKTFDSTFSDNSGFNDTLEDMENLMKYGLHYMTFEKKKNNLTSNVTADSKIQDTISENSVHSVTGDIHKQTSFYPSGTENIEMLDVPSCQSVVNSYKSAQGESTQHKSKDIIDKSVEALHLSKDSDLYKTLLRQISDLYVEPNESGQVQEKLGENLKSHLYAPSTESTEISKKNNTRKKYFQTPTKFTTLKSDSDDMLSADGPKSYNRKKKYFQTPIKGFLAKPDPVDTFKVPSKVTPVSDRKKTDQSNTKKKCFSSPVLKTCEKYKNIVSPIGLYIKKSASSGLVENVHLKSIQVPPQNLKEHVLVSNTYKHSENMSKLVLSKIPSNENIENLPFKKSLGSDINNENEVGAEEDFCTGNQVKGEMSNKENENYVPTIPKCAYRCASEVQMEDKSPKLIMPPSIKKYFQTPQFVIKHEARVKSTTRRQNLFEENRSNDSALMLEDSSAVGDMSSSTPDISIRVTKPALR